MTVCFRLSGVSTAFRHSLCPATFCYSSCIDYAVRASTPKYLRCAEKTAQTLALRCELAGVGDPFSGLVTPLSIIFLSFGARRFLAGSECKKPFPSNKRTCQRNLQAASFRCSLDSYSWNLNRTIHYDRQSTNRVPPEAAWPRRPRPAAERNRPARRASETKARKSFAA